MHCQTSYPDDALPRTEASRLLHLLDEYDRAIKSIRLPFEGDPEVLRVSLEKSLVQAAGISANKPAVPIAKRLKTKLISAIEDAERSANEWQAFKQEAPSWNPAGKLFKALEDILESDRLRRCRSWEPRVPTPRLMSFEPPSHHLGSRCAGCPRVDCA